MEHGLILSAVALVVVAATNLLAERVPVPAPVIQTAIGIGLAFIPAIPAIRLQPDFVLLVVLPPLVYESAVELPWEDFLHNIRPISMLAFGLVAATVAAVAAVAHAMIPGFEWAAAIVLGAIVSPTDPVATSAVASRIGVPQRLVAIIEGEGMVNDAVALTIKTLAVSALLGGTFSISHGMLRFIAIVAGEVAYGWALGWAIAQIRKRIRTSSAEIMISLVTPFAAYLVPVSLGGSGVLATVATGMYIGVQTAEMVPSGTRLHLASVWQVIVYALNGILFLLTGLQFRTIWTHTEHAPGHVILYGVSIALTAAVLRFCWSWPAAWLPHLMLPRAGGLRPMPSRHLTFIAWSGMRGAISLAAALSIPTSIASRQLIVFITACVIGVTLLVQGTTLPWLIRWLGLDQDAAAEREKIQKSEANARVEAANAAIHAIEGEEGPIADRLRERYRAVAKGASAARTTSQADVYADLERRAIAAERRCVIHLHRQGRIADAVLHRIERELDLQQELLENRADHA